MERKRHLGALSILVMGVLFGLAPLAAAQGDPIKVADGVRYLSTGVGQDIRARARSDLPLKLVFANPEGKYYAYVHVRITDLATRKTVTIESEGPWLFVDLKPGTYSVEASVGEARSSISVEVGKKQRVVILRLRP
ncbi:MAG: carboxypeptidase-like regulatory domain-containing protein [Nitrospinota bacterium]